MEEEIRRWIKKRTEELKSKPVEEVKQEATVPVEEPKEVIAEVPEEIKPSEIEEKGELQVTPEQIPIQPTPQVIEPTSKPVETTLETIQNLNLQQGRYPTNIAEELRVEEPIVTEERGHNWKLIIIMSVTGAAAGFLAFLLYKFLL